MPIHRAALAAAVVVAAAGSSSTAAASSTISLHAGRLKVTGTPSADHIVLRLSPGWGRRLEVDVDDDGIADARVPVGRVRAVSVYGGGGDDVLGVDRSHPLPARIDVRLAGGDGDDVLAGADGAEHLLGGSGNDLALGGRGDDDVTLGDGTDTAAWNPGDGSDTIDGQAGQDSMIFNGSGADEHIAMATDGAEMRLVRDVGAVTMRTTGVEFVRLAPVGGADHVAVGDLTGSGVTQTVVDLAATPLAADPDGAHDEVSVAGTAGGDALQVLGSVHQVAVSGVAAQVRVQQADPTDAVSVAGGAGDDTIDASQLAAGLIALTEDGGAGTDALIGSPGDDSAIWNPGDGSDTIDGGDGVDTMTFNGSNGGETVDVSADGGRVRFLRQPGAIAMDLGSVEHIAFAALGGPDTVTVGDLTGTDATAVDVDLAAGAGPPDQLADTVTVTGTPGDDAVSVSGGGGLVAVDGLTARVTVDQPDPTLDRLRVDTLAGADTVDSSGLTAGTIGLEVVP